MILLSQDGTKLIKDNTLFRIREEFKSNIKEKMEYHNTHKILDTYDYNQLSHIFPTTYTYIIEAIIWDRLVDMFTFDTIEEAKDKLKEIMLRA